MAGLARAQQLFNRAILAPIAALIALGGGRQRAESLSTANKGHGHPILAKYLKSNAPNANRPGYDYPGYCAGTGEAARRRRQIERGIIHTQHYPVTVYPSSEGL